MKFQKLKKYFFLGSVSNVWYFFGSIDFIGLLKNGRIRFIKNRVAYYYRFLFSGVKNGCSATKYL
jgi:hypothetical protein